MLHGNMCLLLRKLSYLFQFHLQGAVIEGTFLGIDTISQNSSKSGVIVNVASAAGVLSSNIVLVFVDLSCR